MIEQAEQWKLDKWGKFSASEEWKLMAKGTMDKKTLTIPMFSEGGMTYIGEVAREAYTLYNEEDNGESFAMRNGKAKEHISFGWLINKVLKTDVLTYYGNLNPIFQLYTADSGTSPDSVAWKDYAAGIASFGAELKNPTAKVHMEYLMTIKDQQDLKAKCLNYYTQVQKAMMTFKTDLWLWCSHNEYFPEKDRMLIIEVKADKNFQNDLDARIAAATKEKYKIIEQLKNRA